MRAVLLCLFLITTAFLLVPLMLPEAPEQEYQKHLSQARAHVRSRKYGDAVKEFKKAAKVKPDSAEVYLELAQAYNHLGAHKDAVETARRALPLTSDPIQQTNVHDLAGVALVDWGDEKKDRAKYQEAEQEFRAAVGLVPEAAVSHFNLGTVLLKLDHDADGKAELERCLECKPRPELANSARAMIANPRRARENFAPDFALTTLQGDRITLDGLQGKVVVLDFWATWCPPCRAAVGDLQRFAKKYANQPVVVISISADDDENAWRRFVADKKMVWPQYWDSDGRIAQLFKVHAFPTYLVIDAEGIFHRAQAGGSVFDSIEGEVKKCLKGAGQPRVARIFTDSKN